MKKNEKMILIAVKGALIGIANIIPGVSGGTFALILGIFDRLIFSLNAIGLKTPGVFLGLIKGKFGKKSISDFIDEMKRIDALFLVILMAGAFVAIISSSFLIKYLLKDHYSPTLAFFIGLILPSIAIPWAMISKKGISLLWVIPGIALTFGVSLIMPDSTAGSDNPLVALGTGAIAISAMILPGLSGSYVMLVMGQYQNVIGKLTGLSAGLAAGTLDISALVWLASLAVGMAIGILLFARLLSFLMKSFKSATMAFLIGLLIGSLWVLWPYKDIDSGARITDRKGQVKEEVLIATASNRMPKTRKETMLGGGAFLLGAAGSAGLIVISRKKKNSS